MHDVGIALDEFEALDADRAVFGDAAEIVAAQIDEHDVLGALLGIGGQLGGEALVFFFVAAAGAGAGDGPVKSFAALNFEEHLGRAADDGGVAQLQKIHVRRGIDDAQGAINLERIGAGARGEALAEGHLENISGANVFFRFAHGGQKLRPGKIGSHAQGRAARGRGAIVEGRGELAAGLANFADGGADIWSAGCLRHR